MKYYSLNHNAPKVSFQEAVIQGLAADKGLYFPESITPLPQSFFDNIENLSHEEIAFEAIQQFVGNENPTKIIKQFIAERFCFDFLVVPVENGIYLWNYSTDLRLRLRTLERVLCRVVWVILTKTKKTILILF